MTSKDLAGITSGIYPPEWCFQSITIADPNERDIMVSPKGLCLSTCEGIPKNIFHYYYK